VSDAYGDDLWVFVCGEGSKGKKRQFACVATLHHRLPTSRVGRRIAACAEVSRVVVVVVVLPKSHRIDKSIE